MRAVARGRARGAARHLEGARQGAMRGLGGQRLGRGRAAA